MAPSSELVTVTVCPATVSRATGWVVLCPEHGAAMNADGDPLGFRSKREALGEAERHLRGEHGARGMIRALDRHPGLRRKGGRRRARRVEELAPAELVEEIDRLREAS